ncbi:hypothetical protein Acr_01g0013340 [Actinidia rufa]|uniref:UV-stimulated scaffold protein A C-terminal domain-containing protein n=1 Tax=Actinidia rufa TaxID=165716 RepID=A0A7J0E5A0_9ERIC|nr:hypothetical protein Acr_01g0013340 [Actinidia rufa]
MMMEEEREKVVVVGLIEKATNSTAAEVDPRILKAIKSVVRYSDSELRLTAQTLMNLMKRDHSQVRYLALLIIDELFMRSKLFRTLLVENLDQLLTLSVGFRRNLPLPAPPSVASVLRSKAIEFLEKWNVYYGLYYRQLRLGFDHLKNTLRFQFPNLQANAARIQQERREREVRTKEILVKKFETLMETFSSIKDEVQSTIDEIGECLEIVTASDEPMPVGLLLDDDEMEEFRSSELQQIRLDSLKEGDKVQETSDNKVVFDALRELYKLLVTKHLVSVQEWISVLTRVEVADNRLRDSMLKEFIDIQNRLKSVKKKCEESGCSLPDTRNNEEENIWEEGTIESFENRSSVLNYQSDDSSIALASVKVKHKPFESRNKEADVNEKLDCEDSGTDSDPLRSKLLAEAPLMKWGSFLDNWGSNREFLANQRGLELEGHWGRIDYDAVIPAEKIAELNVQATLYKEDPVEIQPCHAPLSKGGLCQRRDLRVCPFHGPVIPRDDEGKPIKQASLTEETASELETNLQSLQKFENIMMLFYVMRLLASTSRSSAIREDVETAGGERYSARNKKQTLSSMLKKKVTSKDRLVQRLLNTRARDATERQLTQGEDAKYREAFPNQW